MSTHNNPELNLVAGKSLQQRRERIAGQHIAGQWLGKKVRLAVQGGNGPVRARFQRERQVAGPARGLAIGAIIDPQRDRLVAVVDGHGA
ncbi:hypothetical protein, partial [Methylobacter sp.]|uniref:hypothetical protein n=1 Tax=Methylobacter sp. TaxID=2051955 RepID=UPI003DA588C0